MNLEVLEEIHDILNSDGVNYTVFLKSADVSFSRGAEKEAIIKIALGPEVRLKSIEQIQPASVWTEIEECLLYSGDFGAGPSSASINSEELANLMKVLKADVAELITAATSIDSFVLFHESHPAYPVFWDFALLFLRDESATVLIGSSSD